MPDFDVDFKACSIDFFAFSRPSEFENNFFNSLVLNLIFISCAVSFNRQYWYPCPTKSKSHQNQVKFKI